MPAQIFRRPSRPWLRKLLIAAPALAAVFLLLNNLVLPWYVEHGETLEVPGVVGLSLDSAKDVLLGAGLEPVLAETKPSTDSPPGTVVAQNPDLLAVVKQGRRVYLTISGGEGQAFVPSLRGRSVRDARFALERSGLRLGDVAYALSDAYPENTIVGQLPQAGAKVTKGTAVRITVSSGKGNEQLAVPDFVGRTLSEAERLIHQRGLKVGNVTYQVSYDLVPNTVVDQFPRPGESVAAGQAIDLFVVKTGKPKEEIQQPRE